MVIAQVKVKVAIYSTWRNPTAIRWRDAVASLNNQGIVLRYIKMNQIVGVDVFSFSSLTDVGVRVPNELRLHPHLPHFGMRFNVPGSGEKIIVLTIGNNPLVYDVRAFEAFVHKVFEVLISGVKVKLLLARMRDGALNVDAKWETGTLRILSTNPPRKARHCKNVVILTSGGRAVRPFLNMEDLDVEEVSLGNRKVKAWKIRHFYGKESVVSYLFIENKRVRLYLLRYLLHCQGNHAWLLIKASEEFPAIRTELREAIES